MHYELRTYDCVPGRAQVLMSSMGEAFSETGDSSGLVGVWLTDIGPLHRIVQLFSLRQADGAAAFRVASERDSGLSTEAQECILEVQSEIYRPVSFSPPLVTGSRGPVYEMRTYTIRHGRFSDLMHRWESVLEKRLALSPLLLALTCERGGLNRFVHFWPYTSLQHRAETRARAETMGVWPPPGGRAQSVRQESVILMPAPFSPLS